MKVDVEVERTTEALDQSDRAGSGRLVSVACFSDQMRGNDTLDDTQHTTGDLGAAGEQEAQLEWETQYPLAHRLFGQYLIDQ